MQLIVIGEGPGRMEERLQRPFVGPAGRLLDVAIAEAGGVRSRCYLTNATLCRPDDDGDKKSLERAIACCSPRLASELEKLPKDVVILSLGAGASRVTIGKGGIQKYRGFVWKTPEIKATSIRGAERLVEKRREAAFKKLKSKKKAEVAKNVVKAVDSFTLLHSRARFAGRICIPTVHPAFILRGAESFAPVLRIDIRRALRWPFPLEDEGEFKRITTVKAAEKLLAKFSQDVVVDIESDAPDPHRAKITCVGVCDINDPRRIVVMDRKDEESEWNRGFVGLLKKFLRRRHVVGHNLKSYDEPLFRHYDIRFEGRVDDTLVAHRTFASHMPQSLAHVASVYCDTGPWKLKFKQGDDKGAVAGFGVKAEDLAAYNAADVRINAFAWLRMQNELKREAAVYEEDMQMAELYAEMGANGIRVDRDRQRQLDKKLAKRAAALLGEMRELTRRRDFNPAKVDDVRRALYRQFRAPLWLAPPTPTGLPAANAFVLEALKKSETYIAAGKLADLVIRWRSSNDARSEYLDVFVHPDGRVRPTWGQVETGRPRTRQPNVLNLPRMASCKSCGVKLLDGCRHGKQKGDVFIACKKPEEPQPEEQLRDIYVASPGHKLVYFDLSQAEMRFGAFCSGDPVFMESCNKDIHTENACILFPDGAEEIRKDPKGAGARFRDIAKSMGFAVCYGAEAATVLGKLQANGFDVDMDEVEAMLDSLKTSYRRYYAWANGNVAFMQKHGYIRIPISNRIRWTGRFAKPNVIFNTPIQGAVAGEMAKRLLRLQKMKTRNAKQIYYWYDAAIFDTPNDEVADMERIIGELWDEPIVIPHNGLSFKQKIDRKVGERLSDF